MATSVSRSRGHFVYWITLFLEILLQLCCVRGFESCNFNIIYSLLSLRKGVGPLSSSGVLGQKSAIASAMSQTTVSRMGSQGTVVGVCGTFYVSLLALVLSSYECKLLYYMSNSVG